MSYLVLARKYRPKNFSEMVGQVHVVQALSNALQTQRLHHAYLFTGTRGVGKTTVSRILAKSLNCLGADGQGGITAKPCGVCQACSDIDVGRFVDYTELDAASNRGVDEIAQLLEQAVYKPVVGRFKVFMIDEVHMLTNTAFNAMLKTLEEPPEYLKFVLATTDPQKVPATVLSRCLQFNLRPMAPETIAEHLVGVLATEQIPAEAGALRLLARAARGSMRDALSLTDQAIAFGSGQLDEAGVRQMLGSVDRSHVFSLLQALAAGDGRRVVELSEVLRVNGLSAASTLEEMSMVLQRMGVLQAVPDQGESTDPEWAEVKALAAQLPPDETQLLYSLCLHGRAELGLAPDEYAALTMVLLRLLAFKKPVPAGAASPEAHPERAGGAVEPPKKPQPKFVATRSAAQTAPVAPAQPPPPSPAPPAPAPPPAPPPPSPSAAPVAALLRRAAPIPPWENEPEHMRAEHADVQSPAPQIAINEHEPREQAVPAPAPEAQISAPLPAAPNASSAPSAPASTFQTTVLGELWAGWVKRLLVAELVAALPRELALQSELVGQEDGHWTLRVEHQSLQHSASTEKLLLALQSLDASAPPQLVVELGPVSDSLAKRLAAVQAERQRLAQEIIDNDPFVQDLRERWDARIVPGSVKPWSAAQAAPQPV